MDGFKKMNSYHHSQSLLLYHKKKHCMYGCGNAYITNYGFFDKHCKSVESVL